LQLAVSGSDFDGFGNGAKLELQVNRQSNADLGGNGGLGDTEPSLIDLNFVVARNYVGKEITTLLVRVG
jgi:hypothetical protein